MSISVDLTGSRCGPLVRGVCDAVVRDVETVLGLRDLCATSVSSETVVAAEAELIQVCEEDKAVDDDVTVVLATNDGSPTANPSSSETLKYPVSYGIRAEESISRKEKWKAGDRASVSGGMSTVPVA